MSAKSRDRRNAKPDETRRYNALYREQNPHIVEAATKRWRDAHKEQVAAQKKRWAAENQDKIRASRERNKETRAARTATWKRNNREAVREYQRKRRAAGYGAAVGDLDTTELWERSGGMCAICYAPLTLSLKWPNPLSPSIDHIVALANGGEHTQSNCQWVHLVCNMRKGNR